MPFYGISMIVLEYFVHQSNISLILPPHWCPRARTFLKHLSVWELATEKHIISYPRDVQKLF